MLYCRLNILFYFVTSFFRSWNLPNVLFSDSSSFFFFTIQFIYRFPFFSIVVVCIESHKGNIKRLKRIILQQCRECVCVFVRVYRNPDIKLSRVGMDEIKTKCWVNWVCCLLRIFFSNMTMPFSSSYLPHSPFLFHLQLPQNINYLWRGYTQLYVHTVMCYITLQYQNKIFGMGINCCCRE